jgi:Uma2 family endonuclease
MADATGEAVPVPDWVTDLDSFRRWARSEEFPAQGRFAFLDGRVWAEQGADAALHDALRTAVAAALTDLAAASCPGQFIAGRMLLLLPAQPLAAAPDGVFIGLRSLAGGSMRRVERIQQDLLEVEGLPDLVLEVVHPATAQRDTELLRDLYGRAGISEYWLIDAREEPPRLTILQQGPEGYAALAASAGWAGSAVFGRAFRIEQQAEATGRPRYALAVRA